jgi:hypothetical protein
MSCDVIIHVGYGKTASSWLQERIFSPLGTAIYLGKRANEYPQWLLRLNYLDEFAFSEQRDALRAEICERLQGRSKAVVSSEAFTNLTVIFQQSHRIKYVFGDAKIVLVLRNPIDWLISNYKYCVQYENFWKPLTAYLDFGVRRTPFALEKRLPFYIPDFYYSEVVSHYRTLFGGERVLVLRYEDLVTDAEGYGETLAKFIGIPLPGFAARATEKVLESMNPTQVEEQRLANAAMMLDAAGLAAGKLALARSKVELLPDEVRARLKLQLAPYCSDFYPELSS